MPEWFEEWFGEEYLRLYPHRDETDAERIAGLVRRTVPWRPGIRVLDVGAGAGRHARVFAAAGAWCVGFDLSAVLLRRARVVTGAPLVRGDMRRLPFRPNSFDLAVNLFTSFGYFLHDDEHAAVIAALRQTLVPGGRLVLDFLNADTVRAAVAAADAQVDSTTPDVTRQLSADGRYVLKTIRAPADRTYTERVRLLSPQDLQRMFRAAGLTVEHTYGDYDGGPLAPGSPRAIVVGRAA
ncbi:MAG TPA: class I SAM-dependent methyltransferase [Gemmatimonadales bacterium]|nr:class I SAM-dependent methyltransferase [Gemmatimonadales bacterium]